MIRSFLAQRVCGWVLALCVSGGVVHAQTAQRVTRDSAPPLSDDGVRIRHALPVVAVVLGTLATMPFDQRIRVWSQRETLQSSASLSKPATVFRTLGGAGTVAISLAAYGVGVLTRNRTLADVGLHSGEAIVAGTLVGSVLKGTFGRARPAIVANNTASSYRLGRGFRNGDSFQSLPSGHTIAAFALATVIAAESRQRWSHAHSWIAPLVYSSAALVGLSRIYNDKHWASDVVLGAGIGVMTGGFVVRAHHAQNAGWMDRRLLPAGAKVSLAPVRAAVGGTALGAVLSVPF